MPYTRAQLTAAADALRAHRGMVAQHRADERHAADIGHAMTYGGAAWERDHYGDTTFALGMRLGLDDDELAELLAEPEVAHLVDNPKPRPPITEADLPADLPAFLRGL